MSNKQFENFRNLQPTQGILAVRNDWESIKGEEVYRRVLTAYKPSGFNNSMAIASIKGALEQDIVDGVTLSKNHLKVQNFAGPKSLFNSILGLAASHKKRTEGNTLIIDLFEQL
jgi:hypothetical protein